MISLRAGAWRCCRFLIGMHDGFSTGGLAVWIERAMPGGSEASGWCWDSDEEKGRKDETRHSSKGFAGRVLRKKGMLDSGVTLKDCSLPPTQRRLSDQFLYVSFRRKKSSCVLNPFMALGCWCEGYVGIRPSTTSCCVACPC